MQVKQVVAGVIEQEGRILICQRRRDDRQAFGWEFPGGKIEAGETPEEALRRELREELSIAAETGEKIAERYFEYSLGFAVALQFFRIKSFVGEPQNNVFERFAWERRERLGDYEFLEADREVVARLRRGEL